MNAVLAFVVWLERPAGGSFAGNTAPMDWFVLATLGFLFFLLGCFATWAWLLWRRSQQPQPHVRLLMDLEEEAGAGEKEPEAKTAPPESRDPWEKPDDWWKK